MSSQRSEAETAARTLAAHIIDNCPALRAHVSATLAIKATTPTAEIWQTWRDLQAIAATHGIDQAPLYGSAPGSAPHPFPADPGVIYRSLYNHFNLGAAIRENRQPNPRERAIKRDIYTVARAVAEDRQPSPHTLNRLHIALV